MGSICMLYHVKMCSKGKHDFCAFSHVQDEAASRENELQVLAATVAELRSFNPDEPIPVAEETFKKVEADFVEAKQVG